MAGRDFGMTSVRGFSGFKPGEQARLRQFFSGNLKRDLREAKAFAKVQRSAGKRASVQKVTTALTTLGYAVAVEI